MTWHDRLKLKLEELGWTSADLARATGFDPKLISKYINKGVDNPRGETIPKLAKALGVSEQWLMYGDAGPIENTKYRENPNPDILQVPMISDRIFSLLVCGEMNFNNVLLGSEHMPFRKKDTHSNNLVLLTIRDSNNTPELNPGDSVYVDITERPKYGQYVASLIEDNVVIALYTFVLEEGRKRDVLHYARQSLPDLKLEMEHLQYLYPIVAITKYMP